MFQKTNSIWSKKKKREESCLERDQYQEGETAFVLREMSPF